ncbi:hypothetical protein [Maribellus sediminis]|uniref:hypothetical protein n=1 Tax=Maribellus sediminis TaxID=2696285 RepID=UPI00142F4977|nr:hypothetical protein [Maribellus sediminis]
MKKQILILTFFVAALLVGNNAFGQNDGTYTPRIADGTLVWDSLLTTATPGCVPAQELLCVDSVYELQPQAGISYNYAVQTSDADGDDQIHWFVLSTTSTTLDIISVINDISGHSGSIDPGDGDGSYIASTDISTPVYNSPTQTADNIDITWKSFDGETEVVLLVAYVVDVDDCTDNIEVYRIKPQFSFTLDIAPMLTDGTVVDTTLTTAEECVSPIESATWSGTLTGAPGDGTLTVDYGENWVYFVVNANNFADSWLPSFELTYDGGGTATAQWNYPGAANTNTGWQDINNGTAVGAGSAAANIGAGLGSTVGGECIIVRVKVDHGTANENPEPNTTTVTLAVNGTMYDQNATTGQEYANSDLDDLHYTDCAQVDFDDSADYDLTPRPQIISNTSGGAAPFEQASGDTDEFGNN